MTEKKIISRFQVYESSAELSKEDNQLMQKALQIRDVAYAPYSEFKVGAAILLANGEIITGNNQENAAYPSGLCAERTAIFYAGANYPDVTLLKMAISVKSLRQKVTRPTPPCGACRQAIAEYELKQQHPIEIMFAGESGEVCKTDSLLQLLPLAFDATFFGK